MKQKKYLKTLILTLGIIPFLLVAQPVIEWERTFGGSGDDRSGSIQQTIDNGYVMAGYSPSNNGDVGGNNGGNDYWLVKIDAFGNLQWEQNYGGSGLDEARKIQLTTDGGYIMAGSSPSNNGDVGGNNGDHDYWIVKTDAVGTLEWETNLGGSGNDRGWCAISTSDGNYIVVGHANSDDGDISNNNGENDYWIIKLDNGGNILWERNHGGSDKDRTRAIQQTVDGGFVICGYSKSGDIDVGGNNGEDDFWILKITETGDLEWETNLGGSGTETARAIQQTADNGFIIAGGTESSDGDVSSNNGLQDFWLVKINEAGELEWENTYGGSGNEVAHALDQTDDGGFVLIGESTSSNGDVSENKGGDDFWVVKTDSIGTLEWELVLGGSTHDEGRSVLQTNDGGYIASGYTLSNDGDVSMNNGTFDYWAVKLSPCIVQQVNTANLFECEDSPGSNVATFNLSSADLLINNGSGDTVIWYIDPSGNNTIPNPTSYSSTEGAVVYVQVGIAPCLSEVVEVILTATPLLDAPGLSGADNVCQLNQETYQVLTTSGATAYEWTLPTGASIVGLSDEENVLIDWGIADSGSLCVQAVNNCGLGASTCISISINQITNGIDGGSHCPGETYLYPANGLAYSAGSHEIIFPNSAINGCDSVVNLTVTSLENSASSLDTSFCESDFPVVIFGQTYNQEGDYIIDSFTNHLGCDSIIVLNISLASSQGDLAQSICEGDPPIVIAGQSFDQSGTYEIEGLINQLGCDSIVSLNLLVVSITELENADAGLDQNTCDSIFTLNGNIPPSSYGNWTSLDGVNLQNPDQPSSFASGLLPGDNIFVWTLSHNVCGSYDSDTVQINFIDSPIANDDHFSNTYDNPTNVTFNILENDDLSNVENYSYQILGEPAGDLMDRSNGLFNYSIPESLLGNNISFEYLLCNEQCISGCDTAQVNITFTASYFPNTITPNGDGVNDLFVIPDLEQDSEQYNSRELIIFNRWGNIVFQAKPYLNDWGGDNQSGQQLPQGTYYYVLRIDVGDGIIYEGDITILK